MQTTEPLALQYQKHANALSRPIPEYRAKFVTLPHGQYELSVTPANPSSVMNARMGFNPLDCPRKEREPAEQQERDIENRQRAAKRAKQKVRYNVKSMFADHMLTFSYRENVEQREQVAKNWKEYLRLIRIRYPDWQYVAVLEKQERGSYHIHVAVKGRQDIRWILRCWLLAIGQPREDVAEWLNTGKKLKEKSLGAVNVEPPKKRWGGFQKKWKRGKLAEYLTKYIGKEFETSDKHAKKYWHSKNIEQPLIERFWLRADSYLQAIIEAHDLIFYSGATDISMWNSHNAGVVWITGETQKENIGKITQCEPDLELLTVD